MTEIDELSKICQVCPTMGRPAIATRERILKAAFARFSRYGFRRTSMEDIAGEAEVSRAALYLQFANKEEIFRNLSQALLEENLAQAAAALERDAPLAERLCAAFEAKSLRFVEIAFASPHGGELADESSRLCGDLVAAAERRFQDLLVRVLRRAGQSGEIDLGVVALGPGEATELLIRAAGGLKGPGVTADDYRRRLAALIRVFAAGVARAGAGGETRARSASASGARPRGSRAPRVRKTSRG